MTLSEIYYEAACRTSDVPPEDYTNSNYEFSCCAIAMVETESPDHHSSPAAGSYAKLMGDDEAFLSTGDVSTTAERLDWAEQDYRTFMLLMASEAVKC